jgi:hypothetical protein
MPIIGAMKIKTIILMTDDANTAVNPALVMAAPTSPPIIVCEELDGIPNHQVARFQIMAAVKPLPITVRSTTYGSIIPFPMVFATWRPSTRNATKLKNAAQTTAHFGDKTLVDTTVAIEFAAS